MKQRFMRFYHSAYFYPLVVVAIIIIANGLYLTGIFNPNPINTRSGLANSMQTGPLTGYSTIDPSDGYYAQALGHQVAVSTLHGHIAWWNHYEGVGAPLIGGLQAAALFPLQFLLLLANGLFYFHLCLELIAGLATYYFLRKLGLHQAVSAVGGIAFGLNGTYAWLGHTIVNPIAFLPLLMLGIEVARDRAFAGKRRSWLLAGVAIALSIYAGFPETGFLDTTLATGWALVRCIGLDKRWLKSYMISLFRAVALGLGLAAPLLVAFVAYLPHANLGLHATSTADITIVHGGLGALFLPYLYGPIFGYAGLSPTVNAFWAVIGGFCSLATLLLAVSGFILLGRRWLFERVFLAAWTVIAIMATYGILDVNKIVGALPVFSSIAFARYLPQTYDLALIILATFGLHELLTNRGLSVKRTRYAAISSLLCGAAVIILSYALGHPIWHELVTVGHVRYWFKGSIAFALLTTLTVAICVITSRFRIVRYLLICVLPIEAMAMYMVPMLSAPRQATIDTSPVHYLQAHLGTSRFYSLGPIAPNYGTYFGIASVNINDIPQPRQYSRFITKKLYANTNPITFTGTDSVDRRATTPLEAFSKNITNYEFASVKYLVTPSHSVPSQVVTADNLNLVYHDRTADIYQLSAPQDYFSILLGKCSLTVQNRDSVEADCHSSATLLRREQFMPGWKFKLDGKDEPIQEYGDLFQQVSLPPGKHMLSFTFSPPHMLLGYIATGTCVITVIYSYTLSIIRRKRYITLNNNSSSNTPLDNLSHKIYER